MTVLPRMEQLTDSVCLTCSGLWFYPKCYANLTIFPIQTY